MGREKKEETIAVPLLKPGYATYGVTAGGKELVTFSDTTDIVTDRKETAYPVECKGHKNPINFVPRGTNNQLAYEIMRRIAENVTVSSNIKHKANIVSGHGIVVYRKVKGENGEVKKVEVTHDECPDIFDFIEANDYDLIREEIANDLIIFDDAYVKYIFSREDTPRLVQIKALETTCSLVSELDDKSGKSEWHGYSAEWQDGTASDVVATPLLIGKPPFMICGNAWASCLVLTANGR